MASNITISTLSPILGKEATHISNSTYVGIDFGTSTTVVSIAAWDLSSLKISSKAIKLNQKLEDGTICSTEKVPTIIAWHNSQLLVGEGASDLKYFLKKGKNIWYSFKMEIGEDLGAKYYDSELDSSTSWSIVNPKDAARVFFKYLKTQIEKYIEKNGLPKKIEYAISIPASFEANQRKELIEVLDTNRIDVSKQSLIDEPNAAFLSYLLSRSEAGEPLRMPDDYNPKVLVFDFGAGTCDISIIELGKDHKGLYSKNIAISKFEKLGGDDIDRFIASHYLYYQLLEQNDVKESDFKTPERNAIITRLLKTAELLKIQVCNEVSLKMSDQILPPLSISENCIQLSLSVSIDTRIKPLILNNPKLKFSDFNEAMKVFLSQDSKSLIRREKGQEDFTSIFKPIKSALNKANLKNDEIDYVLFIGGSSNNPYVQYALKEYFKESHLLIPQDLQTHVSQGAAIHSLMFNGFGKNIIQPITSEPIIVITKNNTSRVLIPAGQTIPTDLVIIDDLKTSTDGQKAIELPLCIGTPDKILFNLKLVSQESSGFKRGVPVLLELELTADKLLIARATSEGKRVEIEPLNPFANKELSNEERIVLKAERQANLEASVNAGKPTKEGLRTLAEAYHRVGNSFLEAETYEMMKEQYPTSIDNNSIGVAYGNSGNSRKALEFYEKAYDENKENASILFNLAHSIKTTDPKRYKDLMQKSLNIAPNNPIYLFDFGRWEVDQGNKSAGEEKIRKAFDLWKKLQEQGKLRECDYSWFSSAAKYLGFKDMAEEISGSTPRLVSGKLYNEENLTTTDYNSKLIKY